MDNLLKKFGASLQKELINKIIVASQADDFDKETFFTEEHLTGVIKSITLKQVKTKRKNKREPGVPGKKNPWVVFCGERRPFVKEANPEAKFQDIAKLLSKEWNSLTEDEKDAYKQKTKKINEDNGYNSPQPASPKTPINQKKQSKKT